MHSAQFSDVGWKEFVAVGAFHLNWVDLVHADKIMTGSVASFEVRETKGSIHGVQVTSPLQVAWN